MTYRHRLVIFCATILCTVFVSGCTFPQYGGAAKYGPLQSQPASIQVPPNAPSISQQFRLDLVNTDPGKTKNEHFGIDIIAAAGTPVIAVADGRITASYFEPAYGNHLIIDHGRDEAGKRVQSVYLHLQKRQAFRGDTVARGQQIATLGATGVLAGGQSHLHFELHREGKARAIKPIDPNLIWADGPGQITCFDPDTNLPNTPFRTTYPVVCQ